VPAGWQAGWLAGWQYCLRDAARGAVREGDGEGGAAAAGIDNRTMGKIPVENVRDTDVAEE